MGKLFGKTIYGSCPVMNSCDDCEIVRDIWAGFNMKKELTICIDHQDCEHPEYNCSTAIAVKQEDGFRLARHLKIRYTKLPLFIADYMVDWTKIVNPSLSDVNDCLSEIYDCLLDEGCRMKITRSYGLHNYFCY